jgi:probable HAF family extracellular repeat protein
MDPMIDLGTLDGGSFSKGYGVNNRGQVVGSAMNSQRRFRAALYSDAGWIVVDAIKAGSNIPRAYLLRPL